jgi:hypothetical protein
MPQIIAGIALFGLIIFFIIQGIVETAQANPFEFWYIVGSPIALIAGFVLHMHKIKAARWANIPQRGPMKVEITEDLKQQGRYACGLIIDVKISKQDWAIVQKLGVMRHSLCHYPAPSGPIGERYEPLNVGNLDQINYIGFLNVLEMHAAKAELMDNLHLLQSHIERYKEGPQVERFDI